MAKVQEVVHIVQPGEHLYGIAAAYGMDPEDIWSYSKNGSLKQQGRTPAMLAPYDLLMIPVPQRTAASLKVGQTNSFTARMLPVVTVSVTLVDVNGQAIANAPYTVDSPASSGTTSDKGVLTIENVPVTTKEVLVHLRQQQHQLRLRVGYLDPASTRSGQAQRLSNLGYLHTSTAPASQDHLGGAVEAFQVNNPSDLDLQTALVDAHGS
jgi:hypothetical protein